MYLCIKKEQREESLPLTKKRGHHSKDSTVTTAVQNSNKRTTPEKKKRKLIQYHLSVPNVFEAGSDTHLAQPQGMSRDQSRHTDLRATLLVAVRLNLKHLRGVVDSRVINRIHRRHALPS